MLFARSHSIKYPRRNKIKYFLAVVLYLILNFSALSAQNLNGFNGLILIPNAEIPEQGRLTFGVNYLDKLSNPFSGYEKDGYTYYVNLSFLPFLEFHGQILRNVKEGINQGVGDRSISLRLKPFSETEYIPSLLIGWQNIGTVFGGETAIHNHSLYFVATKNFYVSNRLNAEITGGYGTKLMKSGDYQFQGLFGGMELNSSLVTHYLSLSLLAEYDAEWFNAGARVILFNHVNFLFGFLDLKYLSGGMSLSFEL
ncbi:MAG: YjbH domain-containing protein [Leadbetterella sp.]|nr:YjbH domain-containing protein [Leadbetterella sp.]